MPYSLAALERPDLGPEEEEELGDLHPRPLGGEVVAELVEEDHHDDGDDDHDEPAGPAEHRRGRRRRRGAGELPVEPDDLLGGGSGRCAARVGGGRSGPHSWCRSRGEPLGDHGSSDGPGGCIGVDDGVDVVRGSPIMPGKDLGENVGDRDPRDPPSRKAATATSLAAFEPGRGGLPHPAGLVGEAEARERLVVGRLEVEAPELGPVDATERRGDPVRVGQGVGDRAGACRAATAAPWWRRR